MDNLGRKPEDSERIDAAMTAVGRVFGMLMLDRAQGITALTEMLVLTVLDVYRPKNEIEAQLGMEKFFVQIKGTIPSYFKLYQETVKEIDEHTKKQKEIMGLIKDILEGKTTRPPTVQDKEAARIAEIFLKGDDNGKPN